MEWWKGGRSITVVVGAADGGVRAKLAGGRLSRAEKLWAGLVVGSRVRPRIVGVV